MLTKKQQIEIWQKLSDYTIDDNECIEEPFLQFPAGTHREEIWHWIEDNGPLRASDLMYHNY